MGGIPGRENSKYKGPEVGGYRANLEEWEAGQWSKVNVGSWEGPWEVRAKRG